MGQPGATRPTHPVVVGVIIISLMSGEGAVAAIMQGIAGGVWEEVGLRTAVGMTSQVLSDQAGEVFHDYILMDRSPSQPEKTRAMQEPKGSPQKFKIKHMAS